MIEELIVHIGMHKTGSSSIQETFSKHIFPDIEYLEVSKDFGYPNHSGFISTAFLEAPELYHTHVKNGRTGSEVQRLKKRYLGELAASLSRSQSRRVLISAEDLSAPNWKISERREFLRFLLSYAKSVSLVGYVRPPSGFMASAFQQILKGGANISVDNPNLWPFYRERFGPWIELLGKESVTLVPFDRNSLIQGDVVLDFAERVGVDLNSSDVVRVNESLSVEATALLCAFRKFQNRSPYNEFSGDNFKLMMALEKVGENKFCFSDELTSSFVKKHQKDVGWINDQLGIVIQDTPRAGDVPISSEQDLLDIASNNRVELMLELGRATGTVEEPRTVFELVDRLRVALSRDSLKYRRKTSGEESSTSTIFSWGGDTGLSPAEVLEKAAETFALIEPKAAEALRLSSALAKRKMASMEKNS